MFTRKKAFIENIERDLDSSGADEFIYLITRNKKYKKDVLCIYNIRQPKGSDEKTLNKMAIQLLNHLKESEYPLSMNTTQQYNGRSLFKTLL